MKNIKDDINVYSLLKNETPDTGNYGWDGSD